MPRQDLVLSQRLLENMFLLKQGREQLLDLLIGTKEITVMISKSCDKDMKLHTYFKEIIKETEKAIRTIS